MPWVVVKDGAVEAVEFSDNTATRVAARPVQVIEPIGAGDAFASGWLAAHHAGSSAQERLAAGHEAAAAALISHGDQPLRPDPAPGPRRHHHPPSGARA